MNTIQRVSDLAEQRSLTLLDVATLSNIPYVTFCKARRRQSQLSVDTIERICRGLNITMSEFFSEDAAG